MAMLRLPKHIKAKIGQSPGFLIPTSEHSSGKINIYQFLFNGKGVQKFTWNKPSEMVEPAASEICWIAIQGLTDTKTLTDIGDRFQMDSLIIEDIANTFQRSKLQVDNDSLFVVMQMFYIEDADPGIRHEQVSFYRHRNYLISFHEQNFALFHPVLRRQEVNQTRLQKGGSEYLLYALLDMIVDHYFAVFEFFGQQFDHLDEQITGRLEPGFLDKIYTLRKNFHFFHKHISPLLDLWHDLLSLEGSLLKKSTKQYLRDVQDHIRKQHDLLVFYREMIMNMIDTVYTLQNQRTNEVMKILAMVSTIFIPLTFLAGVYGMNFSNMPEMKWPWFYPYAFWGLVLTIPVLLLYMFHRKKWL